VAAVDRGHCNTPGVARQGRTTGRTACTAAQVRDRGARRSVPAVHAPGRR
jgi:hypothetical protein